MIINNIKDMKAKGVLLSLKKINQSTQGSHMPGSKIKNTPCDTGRRSVFDMKRHEARARIKVVNGPIMLLMTQVITITIQAYLIFLLSQLAIE
ncbi:hypothetical protein RIE95_09720 [Acidithiobacillus thiooxidans]|uniref:hypothetical protein n=1 Tax=Acidithiobacillus thiooxidans TaxID=930 RepID=UPI00285E2BFF|nr:hypothetical protein [Acidithiobacillus thiooxidans]MDR7927256.1 hypothetical protein [Acidithiobacillus thiooxidans]